MASEWSRDEEDILSVLSDKAFLMSEFHKKKYTSLQNQLKYYKIPIIVLSGINSVIAVGMTEYMSQNAISATNCLLALTCGIIGSIELYLKISENMNKEYISGRDFYLLHIDIKKTLALQQTNRKVDGSVYLTSIYNKYIKNVANAQLMTGNNLQHDFTTTKDLDIGIDLEERTKNDKNKNTISTIV